MPVRLPARLHGAGGKIATFLQEKTMTVLVIAEHDNGSLKGATLNAVTAALQCGSQVHVLVAGHHCGPAAAAAGRISGVSLVLVADALPFADGLAEHVAGQIVALASGGGYTHLLAPATAYGKNILPRAAALLDIGQLSEITKVLAPDTFERPIYAGSAVATVKALDTIIALTVRVVSFEAAGLVDDPVNAAPLQEIAVTESGGNAAFLSRELSSADRPELTSARIVVAGGRGMGSEANFRLLEPLADKLGAAVGASRAAVDAGFAPNDLQVGQTGKVVAPSLYIAVGISGAIQHLAGMADSKVIVAINQDPDAPIFGVADYGIVGDLFEVLPEMMRALS
jgi:electron transfer flavoprotein alpha subunit